MLSDYTSSHNFIILSLHTQTVKVKRIRSAPAYGYVVHVQYDSRYNNKVTQDQDQELAHVIVK